MLTLDIIAHKRVYVFVLRTKICSTRVDDLVRLLPFVGLVIDLPRLLFQWMQLFNCQAPSFGSAFFIPIVRPQARADIAPPQDVIHQVAVI